MFVITAPPTERSNFVEKLLDINGVVDVHETLTGRRNIHVEAVGTSATDVARLTVAIHELGLETESSELLKRRDVQPFNHVHYAGELVGEDVSDDDG